MQYLINPDLIGYNEMKQILSSMVTKRENILFIIWKDNNQSVSYLHQKFIKELDAAKRLNSSFMTI